VPARIMNHGDMNPRSAAARTVASTHMLVIIPHTPARRRCVAHSRSTACAGSIWGVLLDHGLAWSGATSPWISDPRFQDA